MSTRPGNRNEPGGDDPGARFEAGTRAFDVVVESGGSPAQDTDWATLVILGLPTIPDSLLPDAHEELIERAGRHLDRICAQRALGSDERPWDLFCRFTFRGGVPDDGEAMAKILARSAGWHRTSRLPVDALTELFLVERDAFGTTEKVKMKRTLSYDAQRITQVLGLHADATMAILAHVLSLAGVSSARFADFLIAAGAVAPTADPDSARRLAGRLAADGAAFLDGKRPPARRSLLYATSTWLRALLESPAFGEELAFGADGAVFRWLLASAPALRRLKLAQWVGDGDPRNVGVMFTTAREDWPAHFRAATPEELAAVQDRLGRVAAGERENWLREVEAELARLGRVASDPGLAPLFRVYEASALTRRYQGADRVPAEVVEAVREHLRAVEPLVGGDWSPARHLAAVSEGYLRLDLVGCLLRQPEIDADAVATELEHARRAGALLTPLGRLVAWVELLAAVVLAGRVGPTHDALLRRLLAAWAEEPLKAAIVADMGAWPELARAAVVAVDAIVADPAPVRKDTILRRAPKMPTA